MTDKNHESDKPDSTTERAEPTDDLVTTRHSLSGPGGEFSYTATAGRYVLREEKHTDGAFDGHKPAAELFVTSYTRDDVDAADRPVTFAFNGGPGSSSVWLHLGALGPRRVLMGDAGDLLPPPYGIADNPESLLTVSDLVFIDPVSTGYSRVTGGGKPGDYHGFKKDVESIAEIIRLWTSRNGRWMSPKFLAGESYGTLRASALAGHLQRRLGMYLNGIMLISSVLDMGTIRFHEGNDLAHALYLPTYATLAHYHGKLGDRPLAEVIDDARDLAARDYPYALARGDRLPADERAAVIARISRLTSLSEDYLDRVNMRIEHQRFFAELLRDRRQIIGRLDGRFVGWNADSGAEHIAYDPSHAAITGPYGAALNHHVHDTLGYHNDLPYELLSDRVRPWSYADFEGRPVTVVPTLSEAMRQNPHLKVWVGCGYYDGATPYFAAEHTFARLDLPDSLRGNVEFEYYEAGHMMYVHEPSRLALSEHLAGFVTANANR